MTPDQLYNAVAHETTPGGRIQVLADALTVAREDMRERCAAFLEKLAEKERGRMSPYGPLFDLFISFAAAIRALPLEGEKT